MLVTPPAQPTRNPGYHLLKKSLTFPTVRSRGKHNTKLASGWMLENFRITPEFISDIFQSLPEVTQSREETLGLTLQQISGAAKLSEFWPLVLLDRVVEHCSDLGRFSDEGFYRHSKVATFNFIYTIDLSMLAQSYKSMVCILQDSEPDLLGNQKPYLERKIAGGMQGGNR